MVSVFNADGIVIEHHVLKEVVVRVIVTPST
uniref:Uncharacterized protein n=1 Tax=Candidatus Nitrotoga fabula TaxID=2182327 RepID=A0A2X0R6T1_9PROT|nr:protein of unknown function [Candidatus Nitrotoga fabula]